MYAFNTKAKALEHATPFNTNGVSWTGRLSVGRAVGHTSINLYAGSRFMGTLQGDLLGAALYRESNSNGVEGEAIPLTWNMVEAGIDEVYLHGTAWGTWLCHDITAAVFRRWGFSEQDVYRATPTGSGAAYLAAHLASKLAVPVTTAGLGIHEAWNLFQDGYRAAREGFEVLTRPSSWRFRLW